MSNRFNIKYRISSARLRGYDYGQNGAYFVTICTRDRKEYFGNVLVETQNVASPENSTFAQMQNVASPENSTFAQTQNVASLQATPIGDIATEYWFKIPEHFPFVILDEFQLMPDHLHGIIIIDKSTMVETQNVANPEKPTFNEETQNVASLRQGYKNKFGPQSQNLSSIIRGYKAAVKSFATINKIEFEWQERFYDRIIRDEEELYKIRKYIFENPYRWFDKKRQPK